MPGAMRSRIVEPAQPQTRGNHRDWFEGSRGMDAALPADLFAKRVAMAKATTEITWLFSPHDKQQEIMDAEERFLVAACGRRFGKTMIALMWLVREVGRKQGLGWWIAPTYAASMRAWADMIKFLPRKFRTINKSERRIELTNGGSIEFKSADNPDALRGAGLVAAVFDEGAYIDSYVAEDVVMPMMLTTLGRVLAISSPRAKKGWFWEMFRLGQGLDPEYRSWQLGTASNPYVPQAEIDRLERTLPDSVFRREILAEFLDELDTVFGSIKHLATATRPTEIRPARRVMGIDWARRHDYTVIVVLEQTAVGVVMVDLVRFTGLRYRDQLERVREVYARWQPQQVLGETNNMGEPLVEFLQDGGMPLEGLTTTGSSKPDLIRQMQLAVEHEAIRFLNDPVLLKEFEDYEETTTATGSKFGAPNRQHDDTVIATCLAWRCIAGEPGGERGAHFEGKVEDYLDTGTYVPGWDGGVPYLRLVEDEVEPLRRAA